MPKLTIQTVMRNEEEYIPYLFDSLKKQTFRDFEIVYFDNASADKTSELVLRELSVLGAPHKIIKNKENVGFSAGHNVLFREGSAPYVLLLNPDMYLMPDVLERMVAFLDEHASVAAVTPRLMHWDFARVEGGAKSGLGIADAAREGFTSQVDSLGLKLFRNRRVLEWLTGQTWARDSESAEVRELYSKPAREVFGVSGALPGYRRKILEQILLPGNNLFDPTYHSYKEDLDLAYRLQNAGYTSYVLPGVIAYHDRTSAGPKTIGDFAAHKNKARQSYFIRYHSYKNHLRTLYKNEYWQNFLVDFFPFLWFELKKFGYLLVTNPGIVFRGGIEIIKNFSYTRGARKAILKTRKMYWRGIRRWF